MIFLKWRKRVIRNLIVGLFDEDELDLTLLKKASKYAFTQTDFTYLGDTPVYILDFEPDGNADFKGKLFVDADRLALIRLEYKNIQNIRDFSLLGVSFKEDLREVVIQFKKTTSGKYSLEYLDINSSFEGGFDRPLVITEKNKVVKGRNKQNQLKMDLNVVNRNTQRYQLVVLKPHLWTKMFLKLWKKRGKFFPLIKPPTTLNFGKTIALLNPIQR